MSADTDIPTAPEQDAVAGDAPAAPAVDLTPVWPLPGGRSIPQIVTLPPIPGKRDHEERVTLRDPMTLKSGDRKAVLRAIQHRGAGAGVDIVDGILCLLIDHWTLQLPLPRVTPESLDLLEIPDYDLLSEVTDPVSDLLFPNLAAPGPQPPSNG